jgi:hypothetical protein
MPVSFSKSRRGGKVIPIEKEFVGSVALVDGDMLEISATGRLQKASAQNAKIQYIFDGAGVTSTPDDPLLVLDAGLGDFEWSMPITPVLNDAVGKAGGSTTSIVIAQAVQNYAADDFKGGKIWCKETNEQRTITASTLSNNPSDVTFTVDKAFSKSSVGLTFRVTPLGLSRTACKLVAATFDVISQTIADLTGGNLQVMKVDLLNKVVYVMFA